MDIILDKVESALQESYSKMDIFKELNELIPEVQKARMEKLENKITPQSLVDRGFIYKDAGRASGCDQWQGMGHWINSKKDIHLRGTVSTAKGGTLYLWACSRIQVSNLEELDALIKLFK